MSVFFTGQKVICIRDDWKWKDDRSGIVYEFDDPLTPRKGKVYTVSGKIPETGFLYLEEVQSHQFVCKSGSTVIGGMAWGWDPKDFRPLCSKSTETGMEILKKIALTGKIPRKAKERVTA